MKGMVGERMTRAEIDDRGLVGHRGWAARDEERGGVPDARKIGPLTRLRARYVDEPTRDRPPLRTIVREADQNVGVSAAAGRGGRGAAGDTAALS